MRLSPACFATASAVWIVASVAASASATTLGFEDLGANLPIANPDTGDPEFFYNGYSAFSRGEETDFASHVATFNNDFSDFGGGCCWSGWAYSQTTDTTTPGVENQYSAIAGSGVDGSATYGVSFTTGGTTGQGDISRIAFSSEVSVLGAFFTNTTYAALAMRDGDSFSKQFGGETGDDPDFFSLTVTGLDELGLPTGSVVFDLADYRFVDNSQDFIVMDWTWVDLSSLGDVRALAFELASSDAGTFGINTPAYFAMDDLVFTPEPGTAALLALGLAGLGAARRRK